MRPLTGGVSLGSDFTVVIANAGHASNIDSPPHALAKRLARRGNGLLQLQHEHVFQRTDFARLLTEKWAIWKDQGLSEPALDSEIRSFLSSYGVGCVVLRHEHKNVDDVDSDQTNVWRRYNHPSRQIRLHDRGGGFPLPHRTLIEDARSESQARREDDS
jgi:hypothetical protein